MAAAPARLAMPTSESRQDLNALAPRMHRAIGLMSGTSLDGVDVALIETDGEAFVRMGGSLERPYTAAERAILRAALDEATHLRSRTDRPGAVGAAERLVTATHVAAVEALLRQERLLPANVNVIGFHGQTVLHRPERGLTIQVGDGPALANATALPVVHDFRAADVAAGGQGAPFVPVYHQALATAAGCVLPLGILNLGGIGNLTFIAADGSLSAFDTGPGNALIDDLVHRRTGKPFDQDGELARAGHSDPGVLQTLLGNPFFSRPIPKSLDRGDLDGRAAEHLSLIDALATLVEFTAASVAAAVDQVPVRPRHLIVAGGGARNPSIMSALRLRLPMPVQTADELGWSSGAMEAQAFAYLAVRHLRRLPASFPGTTGVPVPTLAGVLSLPTSTRPRWTAPS